jgi:hypothetical protein
MERGNDEGEEVTRILRSCSDRVRNSHAVCAYSLAVIRETHEAIRNSYTALKKCDELLRRNRVVVIGGASGESEKD